MDTVIREYEVSNCNDDAALLYAFLKAGFKVQETITDQKRVKAIPNTVYYQLWGDHTVTWDVTPLDMDELKAADYKLIQWRTGQEIELLELVK